MVCTHSAGPCALIDNIRRQSIAEIHFMGRYSWYAQDTGLQAVCALNYKTSSACSSQARPFIFKHVLHDLQRGLPGGDQSVGQAAVMGCDLGETCKQ